jgi:hypothetical protein
MFLNSISVPEYQLATPHFLDADELAALLSHKQRWLSLLSDSQASELQLPDMDISAINSINCRGAIESVLEVLETPRHQSPSMSLPQVEQDTARQVAKIS